MQKSCSQCGSPDLIHGDTFLECLECGHFEGQMNRFLVNYFVVGANQTFPERTRVFAETKDGAKEYVRSCFSPTKVIFSEIYKMAEFTKEA